MSTATNGASQKQQTQQTDSNNNTKPTASSVDFTSASDPSGFKYYPDSPTSVLNKLKFETKEPSKFYDPCAESSKMSIRCMEINGTDNKAICNEYFQAYRDCKKEWLEQRRKDRFESRGW